MSDENLVPAVITITPTIPITGVFYIGQYGTSGYASAARGYLYHYFVNEIPITWKPLYFDNSKLSNDDFYDIVIKSLIDKSLPNFEMVIMHSTPDLWPKFWKENSNAFKDKVVNGYCTWETNCLPKNWVKCINGYVNEVWCPSTYNKTSFEESGITKLIRVVPHIFLPYPLPNPENVKIVDIRNGDKIEKNNRFTFYSIGEMNARKGIEDIIKVFCESFCKKDPVRLILKVHYKDYSSENKKKCEDMIAEVLKSYSNRPPVICLLDNMSNKEILALHSIGDCYVGLTKAEGFGLTIFDAFNYGKKIIATGYSGHMDFLGKSFPGLVRYKIGPVSGMSVFSSNYTEEQLWAYPDLDHAGQLMRKMVNL
jgi:glycosyltransferase involved in cell wall biosynthesis